MTTSAGLDHKKLSNQAKIAKKLKKKLLKIVKDNKIDLNKKNKGDKKPEKLYKTLLNKALEEKSLKQAYQVKF